MSPASPDAVPSAPDVPAWGDGWQPVERERGEPFRWMGHRAALHLESVAEATHLELTVKSYFEDLSQNLAVDGLPPVDLVHGWNLVSITLPPGTSFASLVTNRLVPGELHQGDARELGVQVRIPRRHRDEARHADVERRHAERVEGARRYLESPLGLTRRHLRFEGGFFAPEVADGQVVRWMALSGALAFPTSPEPRFLELRVRSSCQDGSQALTLRPGGSPAVTEALAEGWNRLSVAIAPGAERLELEASGPAPDARRMGDLREISVQLQWPLLHGDARRHAHATRQHRNLVLNEREMLSGRASLSSFPPRLGIDLSGTCNIKPPCVYCEWEVNKAREGRNAELPVTAATLAGYGPFFDNAVDLVNCSIGEPFMVRGIDAVLDAFGARGQTLEMATNGQILTDANIARLLGRDVHLYISLDAATAATYARLRNRNFDRIVANLERLIAAKGGPGRLPYVYMVFMPMRANVHEADAFVELCARLQVDRLVLRPLNPSPGVDLVWDRGGYHFDYRRELLPLEELVRLSGRVKVLCDRAGVLFSDQLDFGDELRERFQEAYARGAAEAAALPESLPPAEPSSARPPGRPGEPEPAPDAEAAAAPPPEPPAAGASDLAATVTAGPLPELIDRPLAPKRPICTEPWRTLCVMRRGTFPCGYGGRPVGDMAHPEQAWNGPLLVEIRRALAAGRFHSYCFDSPDCPLVRKREHAHALPPLQKGLLLSRRTLERWRRAGFGRPGEVYRQGKDYLLRASRRLPRLR